MQSLAVPSFQEQKQGVSHQSETLIPLATHSLLASSSRLDGKISARLQSSGLHLSSDVRWLDAT
jgi:hypothetical protein